MIDSGELKNWGWASGKCSVLAEIGTLQLEYQYLTMLSKKSLYLDKVKVSLSLSSFIFFIKCTCGNDFFLFLGSSHSWFASESRETFGTLSKLHQSQHWEVGIK